jgi:hypothetical protein
MLARLRNGMQQICRTLLRVLRASKKSAAKIVTGDG